MMWTEPRAEQQVPGVLGADDEHRHDERGRCEGCEPGSGDHGDRADRQYRLGDQRDDEPVGDDDAGLVARQAGLGSGRCR
jgi:hypothetical protein